jgi:response regulator RpfG family c-di-GMP phosphodiesterase
VAKTSLKDASKGSPNNRLGLLVVDDSVAQLTAFRQDLEGGPYQVWTAVTVAEAQERMLKNAPDLVVIDYHMPQVMGDSCLKLLKAVGPASTRYYLYTSDPSAFRRHREMGFDGVLMLKGKSSVRSQIDAIAKAIVQFRG